MSLHGWMMSLVLGWVGRFAGDPVLIRGLVLGRGSARFRVIRFGRA